MNKTGMAAKIFTGLSALLLMFHVMEPAPAAIPTAAGLRHYISQSARHERTYAKAWKLVQENYYDRSKLRDWDKWQHKYDGKLRTRAQLNAAINEMVDSLGDDYTFVMTEAALKDRRSEQEAPCVSDTRVLPGNVGYIKLDNFSSATVATEMKQAFRKLAKTNGIVLDMRDNHGGFIDAAHDVFSMVMDEGVFTSYNGFLDGAVDNQSYVLKRAHWNIMKNGKIATEKRKPNIIGNKPLAVLVNEDTRSAAEMLAGALRDNDRAVVIGTQTYGKGVLQDAFELGDDILMKVVTAKYFLPDGTNIHGTGLTPNIEVAGSEQAQLNRAVRLLTSTIAEGRNGGRRYLAGT
jgi:C-terminal processing protease CtpA/Prc